MIYYKIIALIGAIYPYKFCNFKNFFLSLHQQTKKFKPMLFHFCIEGFKDYRGYKYLNLASESTIKEFDKNFDSIEEAICFGEKQINPGIRVVYVYTKNFVQYSGHNFAKCISGGDVKTFYVNYDKIVD